MHVCVCICRDDFFMRVVCMLCFFIHVMLLFSCFSGSLINKDGFDLGSLSSLNITLLLGTGSREGQIYCQIYHGKHQHHVGHSPGHNYLLCSTVR